MPRHAGNQKNLVPNFDVTFTIPSRRSHLRSQFLHRKYRPQPCPLPVQALEIRRNQDATTPHGRPSVEVRRRTSLRNAMRNCHGRHCRRCGLRQNRIKAHLRAFRRWKVKVLGFCVKARPRPKRMALRWCQASSPSSAQLARRAVRLRVCCFPVPPPVMGWSFFLDIENRYRFWA